MQPVFNLLRTDLTQRMLPFYRRKQQVPAYDFAQERNRTLLSLLSEAALPIYATEHGGGEESRTLVQNIITSTVVQVSRLFILAFSHLVLIITCEV